MVADERFKLLSAEGKAVHLSDNLLQEMLEIMTKKLRVIVDDRRNNP